MRGDDEDEDRLTREEILDRYGWGEGEREQVGREMAERQRQIDAEACKAAVAREAERQREPVVERTFAQSKQDEAAATKYWKGYVRDEIDKSQTAMIGALGDLLVKERERGKCAVDDVKSMYRDMSVRFDDHPRHDEIVALYKTIDELRGRLDKLEAAPANRTLKVAS